MPEVFTDLVGNELRVGDWLITVIGNRGQHLRFVQVKNIRKTMKVQGYDIGKPTEVKPKYWHNYTNNSSLLKVPISLVPVSMGGLSSIWK